LLIIFKAAMPEEYTVIRPLTYGKPFIINWPNILQCSILGCNESAQTRCISGLYFRVLFREGTVIPCEAACKRFARQSSNSPELYEQ
jgi:hypothetical protein